jgi:glycosyltransferase involved in cell wall biosynthesis
MNPEVSIIIPVFNNSRYIEKTLLSLINQSFKDFEVIIINDGSSDDSIEITDSILSQSNIPYQIFSQENKGVSVARNKGLDLASGNYIVFLDGDDYIGKNHLKWLYESIVEKDCDFSFTQMLIINKEGVVLTKPTAYDNIKDKSTLSGYDLIKLELMMKIPFRFCQLMYDKSVLNENNLRFSANVSYGEDTDFALKSLVHIKNVGYTGRPSYFYLQNDSSSTSHSFLERFNFIKILEDLAVYYHDYDMPKEELINYPYLEELIDLITNYRIPKAIFGNLMYLFYRDYPFNKVMAKMREIDYVEKLRGFKPYEKSDLLFLFKIEIFMLSPKIYYTLWKTFKNSI